MDLEDGTILERQEQQLSVPAGLEEAAPTTSARSFEAGRDRSIRGEARLTFSTLRPVSRAERSRRIVSTSGSSGNAEPALSHQ